MLLRLVLRLKIRTRTRLLVGALGRSHPGDLPPGGGILIPGLEGARIALVHDWLTGSRGGEKVLDAICQLIPGAPVLTLLSKPEALTGAIAGRPVRRSFIHYLPLSGSRYREYLPLFPTAIEQFDLDDVDLVISTSHCAAKAVVPTGRAVHVCYCHSPMRYAWDDCQKYTQDFGFPGAVKRAVPFLMNPIRIWDKGRYLGDIVRMIASNTRAPGDIIGDLNSRRGQVLGMENRGTTQVVKANVPLASMFGYATDLRSMTQGRAAFSMELSHYAEVPQNIAQELVAKSKSAAQA